VGVIDRCLELDPNRRPRDAGEVLELLARRERRRRQRPVLIAAVLAPLVLVLLMAAMLAQVFADARQSILDQDNQHSLQVRERNQHIAELVATDVRLRLRKRIELLRRLAEDDEFADYVSRIPPGLLPPDDERRMDAWLRKEIPLHDGKAAVRRGQAAQHLWDSVSVVTPRGYIVS